MLRESTNELANLGTWLGSCLISPEEANETNSPAVWGLISYLFLVLKPASFRKSSQTLLFTNSLNSCCFTGFPYCFLWVRCFLFQKELASWMQELITTTPLLLL